MILRTFVDEVLSHRSPAQSESSDPRSEGWNWTPILVRAGGKVSDCFAAEVVDVEVGRSVDGCGESWGLSRTICQDVPLLALQVEETVLFGEMVGK